MRAFHTVAALAIALGGCAPDARILELPREVVSGDYASALIFLERDDGGAIESAHAHDLTRDEPLIIAVESLGGLRVRMLVYEGTLADQLLTAGELEPPTGESREVPEPEVAYLAPSGAGGWQKDSSIDASALAWRLPKVEDDPCEGIAASSKNISGLGDLDFQAVVALDDTRALVAGTRQPDLDSLLGVVTGLDQFESIASPVMNQKISALGWSGVGSIAHGSTDEGTIYRIDLDSMTVTSSRALPTPGEWLIEVGLDGTVVFFEDWEGALLGGNQPRRLVPGTFQVESLEAPEPLTSMAVINQGEMYGAFEERVYRYQGGRWTLDETFDFPVSSTFRAGDDGEIGVIVGGQAVFIRGDNGVWTERPGIPRDMLLGRSRGGDRFLVGGGGGLTMAWEGEWCQLGTGINRRVQAMSPTPDKRTVYTVTYNAGIVRLDFPHPN